MDVFLPGAPSRAPVLMMVHGGAWTVGAQSMSRVVDAKITHWVGEPGFILEALLSATRHGPSRRARGHGAARWCWTPRRSPRSLLAPGRGKTQKAYVWVYRTTNFVAQRAMLFDFCTSRGGEHPQRVRQDFKGTLVTDDFSGYHKRKTQGTMTGSQPR